MKTIATVVQKTPTVSRFGEQWLTQHQTGYSDLTPDDRDAIREFALLWTVFEVQTLFGDGRISAIIAYVDEFAQAAEDESRKLLTAPFIPHIAYFRAQFIDPENGETNAIFNRLNFQDPEHKQLVSQALVRLSEETPELVKALLIIVHRLRDNLFKGLRWHHCKNRQRDDLYHASKVLMKAVDVSRF